MSRSFTLFTGQWADLTLEEVAKLAAGWGYGGLEIAVSGEHLDAWRWDDDDYIADRLKRMINAAGYKVWPAELEATLYKHPDIKEVAVVSAPDARRGETVKAYVVLKDAAPGALSGADLVAWCRNHMAAYKVPRMIEFVDSLPRSATGKIQWRMLQEREWAK